MKTWSPSFNLQKREKDVKCNADANNNYDHNEDCNNKHDCNNDVNNNDLHNEDCGNKCSKKW